MGSVEFYSTIKKKEIVSFAKTEKVGIGNYHVNKLNLSETNIACFLSLVKYNLKYACKYVCVCVCKCTWKWKWREM